MGGDSAFEDWAASASSIGTHKDVDRRDPGSGRRDGARRIAFTAAGCPSTRRRSSSRASGRSRSSACDSRTTAGNGSRRSRLRRDADRDPHGRRRLPRAERGHPGGGAARLRPRRRGRRRPARLARAGRGPVPDPRPDRRHGDPAPRRDDPEDVAHEPLQGRGRRRARARAPARAGRAGRDRRRGHAGRRGAASRRASGARRRRPEDDRQRPLRAPTTRSGSTRRSRSRPRPSTACTRPPSPTTA